MDSKYTKRKAFVEMMSDLRIASIRQKSNCPAVLYPNDVAVIDDYVAMPKSNVWYCMSLLPRVRQIAKACDVKIRVMFRGPRETGWSVASTKKSNAYYFIVLIQS